MSSDRIYRPRSPNRSRRAGRPPRRDLGDVLHFFIDEEEQRASRKAAPDARAELGPEPEPRVEPQPAFTMGLIAAVAGEAVLREQRPDVAVEVDLGRRPGGKTSNTAATS